jgi:hypothetical protein
MKNSNDTIGNRTRDVPACGTVPQPTAPPRAPLNSINHLMFVTKTDFHEVRTPIFLWNSYSKMLIKFRLTSKHFQT